MRIVISNPDGIGDVVLRLPLFEALREAGHELLLLCRPHAASLLHRLNIRVEIVHENPYVFTLLHRTDFAPAPLDAAEAFAPDLLIFAPYHWTIFEEHLAMRLATVSRVRMNGRPFEYLRHPGLPLSGKEQVAPVEEWSHESEKNQALCRAVLGECLTLGDPVLHASEEDIRAARASLAATFGDSLCPNLWIGCMGNTGDFYGNVKDWGDAHWREMLRFLVEERGGAMALLGGEGERDSLERLCTVAENHIHLATGNIADPAIFSQLLGLIHLSRGYLGKDTGPMHLAAALGKPVVAVYGGGHWPRFTPRVTPSWAGTMGTPCRGCGWSCHMPESLCVKRVPAGAVKTAVDTVICGKATQRECVMIGASAELLRAAESR